MYEYVMVHSDFKNRFIDYLKSLFGIIVWNYIIANIDREKLDYDYSVLIDQ